MPKALIVDDDAASRDALAELVEMEGFEIATASSLREGRLRALDFEPDLVLCDLMLGDGRGTELLQEVQESATGRQGRCDFILVTAQASVESAVEALRLGAHDYLTKPVDVRRLERLLAGVRRTLELREEVSTLRDELRRLGRFGPMVGTSPAMQEVYDLLERVAPTEATVFLVGESGTGKELAAQAVHQMSRRRKAAWLPVNCGAISANLIESELFGHEKGSFTGANRRHKGYFERASGGTLFLDEITEMPAELQVKLLRVLETGEVLRVGGTEPIEVDVRVVAATNREPEDEVREGSLREDLFYRLQVFPVQLPPLREREGDVELLVRFFVDQLNERHETRKRVADEVFERLESHSWPGNVRELKNVVERAYILADDVLSAECVPLDVESPPLVGGGTGVRIRVGASLEEAEKRLILATLEHLDGDKKEAAEVLGISLKTLYNRLNRYRAEEGGES